MNSLLRGLGLLLFLCALTTAALADSNCATNVGKVSINVPAPAAGFVSVGADKFDYFDHMVPERNRLLCVFVTTSDLNTLKNPASMADSYMLVEDSRGLEDTDASADFFNETISSVKDQFGDTSKIARSFREVEDEINRKLRESNTSNTVSIGQPIKLGSLFQMPRAYSIAMIVPYTSGGVTNKVLNAAVLMHIHNRLVFVYLYTSYKDENSIKWLGEMAEAWTKKIQTANPE